jgi:ABC-type Mn2+/Zn2+ transport system ATPase subunit
MIQSLHQTFDPILRLDSHAPPSPSVDQPISSDLGVVDDSTFRSIEVELLFEAVNETSTTIGAAVLMRSLRDPLRDLDVLKAKQGALLELDERPEILEGLKTLIKRAKRHEKSFYELLYGSFMGMFTSKAHDLELEGYGYSTYIEGTQFLKDLVDGANALPRPSNPYLEALIGDIKALESSRAYQLAKGPCYRAERGMITASEKRWWTPALRFNPSLFKPIGLLLFISGLFIAGQFVPLLLDMIASAFWLFLLPVGFLYIPMVGSFDRDGCIYPLRDIFKASPEIHRAVDALGLLDELFSMRQWRTSFGHPAVLPSFLDEPCHQIKVTDVRNPILAKGQRDYVGNAIDLTQKRLTLITGPNSGGKTAFCKTLAQTQLLAQIGGYVPAESAAMTVADHIYYQPPEISQLADGEGRFGTELRRTKAIFLAATPMSLVIMDELSEGTTHEEKIEISKTILDGFSKKGNSTLLITHNHALVDQYQKNPLAIGQQVEFKDDQPTYRLIEGISRVSHAQRVAEKIGFGKADIDRHLKGG